MRKKTICLSVIAVILVILLICIIEKGKIVKAKELIKSPFNGKVESIDMNVNIDAECETKSNLSFLGYEIKEEENSEGDNEDKVSESKINSLFVKGDLDIRSGIDVSYLEGDIVLDVLGKSKNNTVNLYIEKEENNIITYSLSDDTWIKETKKNESDYDINKILEELDTNIIKDLKINKNKEGYEVTGHIDLVDIMDKYESKDENKNANLANIEEEYINQATFTFKAVYGKDEVLKSLIITGNLEDTNIKIVKCEITITINSINNIKLEVPDNVKTNAFEVKEYSEEEIKEDVNENVIYEITDTNEQNIAMMVFGKPVATNEDIIAAIADTYMDCPSEEVINAMVNILNTNTPSKLRNNLSSYNSWKQFNKTAITYFYGLGVFSISDLKACGVDEDLLLEEYSEIHHIPVQINEESKETSETE